MRAVFSYVKRIFDKLSFSADMFKAAACLRARGQPEVSRLCPGIVSLLIGLVFIAVVVANLVNLLRYQKIKSSTVYQTQKNVTAPFVENIPISLSPAWMDHVNWTTLFTVNAYLLKGSLGSFVEKDLELEKCDATKWTQFNETFKQYVMVENICIKNSGDVKVQGASLGTYISLLYIQIKRCNSAVQSNCASDAEFNKTMEDMYKNKYNFFSLYLKDTSINAKIKDAIQEKLTLGYNFFFNNLTRTNLKLYLGTYTLETDHSIWPIWQDIQTKTGYYISEVYQHMVNKRIQNTYSEESFGQVVIQMSTNKVKYIQKRGKLDDIVSYLGGLFGLIVAFFAFFIYNYNKYSYQLLVAQYSFNYHESGEKVRFKEFSFLKYIKFQIYDWIYSLRGKGPKWPHQQMVAETKDEACLYLDVEYLFRKMRLIDLGLRELVSEKEEKILFLTEPLMVKQVEQRRNLLEYYEAVIGGKGAKNIEDLRSQQFRRNQLVETLVLIPQVKSQQDVAQNGQAQNGEAIDSAVLREQLKNNLRIEDESLLDSLIGFKDLYKQSKQVELEQEHEECEQKFALAYMNATPDIRTIMLDKIPLKILFRLNDRIEKIKNGEDEKKEEGENDQAKNDEAENQVNPVSHNNSADN